MSYILDALKKSEQQRQYAKSPTLLTAQTPTPGTRRPSYLLNGLLAAILICSGIVVGWLRPWQPSAPAEGPVAALPDATSLPPPATAALSGPTDGSGNLEHAPLKQSTPAPHPDNPSAHAAAEHLAPTLVDAGPASPSAQSDTGPRQATTLQMPAASTAPGAADEDNKRVMGLNELPASLQREIPNIVIAFHAYSSNPKERRVMINGTMHGQGEPLAPGLVLDEITPDGVILGYKGYRFHQGVR